MSPSRRRSVAAVVIALVAAGCSSAGGGTASTGTGATTTRRPVVRTGPDGPYTVGVHTETFVDRSRPTKENHGAPAKPERTMVTTIFYPAQGRPASAGVDLTDAVDAPPSRTGKPFPLIVFSHGVGSDGPTYGIFLRPLAQAGYVVAAPTYPLTSGGAPGGTNLSDYDQQPKDVSFVVTEMLRVSRTKTHLLHGLIDPRQIAAGGHSLGAATTLGLAFDTCCPDPRVDAYVSISGIQLPFGTGHFDYRRHPPLLLIHGDHDGTLRHEGSVEVFGRARSPKFFITLLGAPHTPVEPQQLSVITKSVIDFLDRYVKQRADGLTRLQHDGITAGVSTMQSAA